MEAVVHWRSDFSKTDSEGLIGETQKMPYAMMALSTVMDNCYFYTEISTI